MISSDLHEAVRQLRAGKLVGIPTETVYGLAANALDPEAVAGIFEAKNRPSFDPLIVHIGQMAEISRLVTDVPVQARQLMDNFWPGPLTIILPKSELIPDIVTSGLPHVGIRMPKHPLTLRLLQSLPFPLAAPSANPFGYVSPTTAQHVLDQLEGKLALVLDGGPSQVGIESTIVSFAEGTPKVLRLGGISMEDLTSVLGESIPSTLSQSQPAAPGQLDSHYAPHRTIALLPHGASAPSLNKGEVWIPFAPQAESKDSLSLDGTNTSAAQRLFALLRKLDYPEAGKMYVEMAPESGLGRAVNDRLMRAAHRA
ncbi:MAG: L-threonylcarbamoyladenylate synthase [Schleiferiaceae bacterium]|nr:L-threonylcarbamoyladenylate synthase [Schleiferiaceae bacterium]